MNIRLQLFLFTIWFLILVYLLVKIRKRSVNIRFALPWIILDILLVVITAFPQISFSVAVFLGIETPSNMMFFFGLVFVVFILFSMTMTISTMNLQIKELSQRVALNEFNGEQSTTDK